MEQPAEDMDFNAKLAAAARNEPALWTSDCLEPDVLIDLIEKGADSPAARRQMAHVVTCAYCRREFEEMEKTLRMAAKAQELQAAIPVPDSPVRSVEKPSPLAFLRQLFAPPALAFGAAVVILGVIVYGALWRSHQAQVA